MPGKRSARHAKARGRRQAAIGAAVVAVVAVAAVVLAFGWLPGTSSGDTDGDTAAQHSSSDHAATDAKSSGDESPSSAPSEGDESPTSAPSAPSRDRTDAVQVRMPKPLRACAASISEEERAVGAAAVGVANWKAHVQARTDMLEGRISVEEMDAIWARTRAAGPQDEERFKAVLVADDQPSRCSQMQGVSASDQKLATQCVQRSQAAARALESAEAAMNDWEVHLANMAMYADHEMSASMAQDKWVQAWRDAPKNISAYATARAALSTAPACQRVPS